jgi:AraC-like DNA-binding protein
MAGSKKLIDLSLLHAGHVLLNKNWNYENVISPFSRLYYIANGSGKVYHHGQEFELKPGYMYLIPSFSYSLYKCNDYLEQYYVHFLEEVIEGLSLYHIKEYSFEEMGSEWDLGLFKKLIELNPDRNLLRYNPKSYDNEDALRQLKVQNNHLSLKIMLQNQGILLTLLAYFLKEKKTLPKQEGKRNSFRFLPIYEYIQKHLNQNLSVVQLANLTNLSPDHFSRLFKEHSGFKPIDYIQIKRIERAKLLLTTTDNSLSQIAFMVGMSNYSHFIRVFQKITSTTPTKYKRESLAIQEVDS